MKVKKLIKVLKKTDGNLEVFIDTIGHSRIRASYTNILQNAYLVIGNTDIALEFNDELPEIMILLNDCR